MKITLTKFEDGTTPVDVALADVLEALTKGGLSKQDDIIIVSDVPYKWSTFTAKLPISDIDITGAAANQIIKMNGGGTALAWSADA